MRHRKPLTTLMLQAMLFAAIGVMALPAAADHHGDAPSADMIVERMEAALTPATTMLGKVRVATDTGDDGVIVYDALVARRTFEDGLRTTVLFSGGEKGFEDIVMLWGTQHEGQQAEALYLPSKNRVRTIVPVQGEEKMLRTDFTREDLGLVPAGEHSYKLLGREMVGHEPAWKIEAVPADSVYFSRIVTWVSAETWLPLQRHYFDRADRLWKVLRYHGLLVDGHPTVTAILLDDVQTRTSSEMVMRSVRYDTAPHESLFRKTALGEVPGHDAWKGLEP